MKTPDPGQPDPVTIADVARHLRVSKATVSVALRGKPGVSQEVAARIRAAAVRMGYHLNPLLGIHMAQVRNNRRARFQATIAWINSHVPIDEPRTKYCQEGLEGARRQAEALGYALDEFRMRAPDMTPENATRILRARQVAGLIIGPLPAAGGHLELGWEHFSALALGYSLASPELHRVSNGQRETIQEAFDQLERFGCKRIGAIINEENNDRVRRAWTSGAWDAYHRHSKSSRIEPLIFHERDNPLTSSKVADWVQSFRPDGMIIEDYVPVILAGLDRLGLKPGRDIALASRKVYEGEKMLAGINQDWAAVGAAAVNFLVGMIQRNERGVPRHPMQLLLPGTWQSGSSVIERSPATTDAP
jgi:DNA-binding LacI/PurR family transcriptional regulator